MTTARGTSLSVSVSCPANIECGVTASTKVLRVIGTQTMYLCGSDELYSAAYSCEKTAPNQCPSTAWNTTLRLEHLFVMVIYSVFLFITLREYRSLDGGRCRANVLYRISLWRLRSLMLMDSLPFSTMLALWAHLTLELSLALAAENGMRNITDRIDRWST